MPKPISRQGLIDFCENNKYTKWYFQIIDHTTHRGWNKNTKQYTEKHHILPKSIILNNDIVYLTAREHYICHLLLTKMFKDAKYKTKMCLALYRLIHGNKYDVYMKSSRMYENIKKWHSVAASERSKLWWSSLNEKERKSFLEYRKTKRIPRKFTEEHRKVQSQLMKKRLANKENHPLYKKGHSEETKQRMSINAKLSGLSKGKNNPMFGKIGCAKNKKWYHNPSTNTEKYFYEDQQTDGYILGRLKVV